MAKKTFHSESNAESFKKSENKLDMKPKNKFKRKSSKKSRDEEAVKSSKIYRHSRSKNRRILFIESAYKVSHKTHFINKLSSYNLWMLLAASFITACLIRANWNLTAIVLFLSVLAIYRYKRRIGNEESVTHCARKIQEDPDRLKAFLEAINAPQDSHNSSYNDSPCEWINDIVGKFWPYINSIVQARIDAMGGFSNKGLDVGNGHIIYFERFTLGDKPPVVSSIRVKKTGRRHDEIVMILKVIYFGNCLLSFNYKTKVFLKAKAGVKDVYFRGDAILTFRPLMEAPPFVGGVSFCLNETPLIDYDGIHLANIADNKLFKNFILTIISNYLVSPNKIYILLLPNPHVRRELKFPRPTGLCYIQIIEAENLPKMDPDKFCVLEGSSDPFCKIRVGSYHYTTRVIYACLNPYFGQNFSSPVHDIDDTVRLEVFDKDEISANDFIGSVEFRLCDIYDDKNYNGKDKWLPLGRSPFGAIHFRVAVFDLSSNKKYIERITAAIEESQCKFPPAILSVYINYLSRLSSPDEEENLKPAVSLKFSGQTFETRNNKPPNRGYYHMEEFCHFMCNDIKEDVLEATVVGDKSFAISKLGTTSKLLGVCRVTVAELIDAPDMTLNQEFPIQKTFKFEGSEETKEYGVIKMFVCLQVCKYSAIVIDNLKIPASVKAHIEEANANHSLARVLNEPISSLRNPCKTIKSIAMPCVAKKGPEVTEDRVPLPVTLGDQCHVKARIIWPNRTLLSVEVLKIVQMPADLVDRTYKYSLTVKLRLKVESKKGDKKSISKSMPTFKSKKKNKDYKKLATMYTKRRKWESDGVAFNERLIFKLSPINNIDNHVLEFQLMVHKPRKYFAVSFKSLLAATSAKVDLPYVDFRGDPIEKWFELNVVNTLTSDKK